MGDTGGTSIHTFFIVVTSIILIVSLAWNEAIQSTINYYYPAATTSSYTAKIFYAVILTIVVIIALKVMNRLYGRIENLKLPRFV